MISHIRSMLRYGVMAALAIAYGLPVSTAWSQASGPGLDDPTIVAIFDAANTYDMETGSLAVSKGHSEAVRDFWAMLVRDHGNVPPQGRDLAKMVKVNPTPPP